MGYTIGVSTGLWKIAHQQSPGKSLEFMGLARKALWSIYKGVRFAQIDLESIAEFLEDDLDQKIKKVKEMGIEFGVHGEVPETAGRLVPFLDSAEEDVYKRSHERLIYSAKNCARIGSKYYLLHSSASRSWHELSRDLGPTLMVDIWGRRFEHLFNEEKWLLDWAIKKPFIIEIFSRRGAKSIEEAEKDEMERFEKRYKYDKGKEPSSEEKERAHLDIKKEVEEEFKKALSDMISRNDISYGVERIAFYIIAKWMESGKTCPSELRATWKGIARGGSIDNDSFREKADNWVPAIAAAYTWGHFNPKDSRYEDPKKYFEKMWMAFETPMTGAGVEEAARLAKPMHIYHMVKNLKMKNAVVVLDFEHQLSSWIDPFEQVKALPEGEGKWIKIIHIGYPAVMAPAHIPIPLGSDAQFWVYKILWEYRKKGFKDGIIIFERGGGDEPIQETVLALKKVTEYLEKDVAPEKLPEDFYGLTKLAPETIRQRLQIKNHALDPLKGMLMVPEEEYDFLGTSAAAQRKLEEWKKERLK